MQYMCLIYDDETGLAGHARGRAERGLRRVRRRSPSRSSESGNYSPATRCSRPRPRRPSASANGETLVTDGPFAETKEQLGGYYLIEAKDVDEAMKIAARIPSARATARSRCGPSWSVDGLGRRPGRRGVPGGVRARGRDPDPRARRLRPRRGRRPGGVRDRRGALAARRRPGEPGAWIVTTARNRAIDRLRRERTLAPSSSGSRGWSSPRGGGRRREHDPRRAARADLHLLPPGARRRGAGRADAAAARRPDDARDRPRLPGRRADDGAAARPGEAQDPRGRHPVPRAAATTTCPSGSTPCSPSST